MFGRKYKRQLEREQARLEEKHRALVETERKLETALEVRDGAYSALLVLDQEIAEREAYENRMEVRLELIDRLTDPDASFVIFGVVGEESFTGVEVKTMEDLNDITTAMLNGLDSIVAEVFGKSLDDLQQQEDEAEEARVRDGA